MLTKESFVKGIKDMRAVFGINPDKETLEIWYRHLAKLDDKYFLAGVSLMAENEAEFYPNTNIVFKIKEYAQKAREKELRAIEQIREPWQEERYRLLCENHNKLTVKKNKELINRFPELESVIKNLSGMLVFKKEKELT